MRYRRVKTLFGEVHFSVDLRYHTDNGMSDLEEQTKKIIMDICGRYAVEADIERYWRAEPTHFNEVIISCVEEAARENDMDYIRIISGAGHDAVFINEVMPAGMLFVPSIKGMSHCPQEETNWEDIVKGAAITADVLLKLDDANI